MKIIILPYRDGYFWNDFGTSVRDLQISEILSREHDVTFINRPVSIYERVLNKHKKNSNYKIYEKRIDFIDVNSFDVLGPLRGRVWTRNCYDKILKNIISEHESLKEKYLLIDFSPFANLQQVKNLSYCVYWYDLIDNFSKHNRYTNYEKRLVLQKYDEVGQIADVVTGVSSSAINAIEHSNKLVLPNGVYNEITNRKLELETSCDQFDFGFVGFITNKLDVDFINKLSEKYSVGIWGKFFDNKVELKLNSNVKIHGAFRYQDLPSIMKCFKVGLLPYLANRSHDESPLKMYEYFKYSKPCLASIDYEIKSEFYFNYSSSSTDELDRVISLYMSCSGNDVIKDQIRSEWMFDFNIMKIITDIEERFEM